MNPAALALALCLSDLPVTEADLYRFPMEAEVEAAILDSDHYRGLLQIELERERIDPAFWREYIAVVNANGQAWSKLLAAHRYRYPSGYGLYFLKEEIGAEAYYAGIMPPVRPFAPRLWAPFLR